MIACITGCFYRKTQKYDHLDLKEIKPFIPPIVSGKVIKVYDGDTITIVSDIPGLKDSPFYKFSIRLNGIDTPEIRGKTEDEKLIAIKARDDLSNLILGDIVYLKKTILYFFYYLILSLIYLIFLYSFIYIILLWLIFK